MGIEVFKGYKIARKYIDITTCQESNCTNFQLNAY